MLMKRAQLVFVLAVAVMAIGASGFFGSDGIKAQSGTISADAMRGLMLRSLGPAYTTGRVQDITVDPNHPTVYYIAAAAGGLWKSENRGQTWTPIFDQGGAFNLCCIVIDPKDSNIL